MSEKGENPIGTSGEVASGTSAATCAREGFIEVLARAQCTPGEIAASLWARSMCETRVEAQQIVRDRADDLAAWRLAGRADVRIAAHGCATGEEKLSPGQAAAQAAWGTQHLGWGKSGVDPAKQGKVEQAEAGAATKLKVAG